MSPRYRRLPTARAASGATLVEMLIAVAIFSIGVVGLIGAYAAMEKAVQTSKGRSLANNIAQEQMQILMESNYLQLVPTSNPSYNASVSPTVAYDTSVYPPQSITEGSINFTRYTYIQVVTQNNGAITVVDPTTPDTGMRMITVSVIWTSNGIPQVYQLSSILANPNTVESNVLVTGTVTNSKTGAAINDAVVDVAEDVGWTATTNSSGQFSLSLAYGNFNLTASAYGYFTGVYPVSVAPLQDLTQNITLLPMSSGTVEGTVYFPYNDLLVTQVVASTMCPVPGSPGQLQDVEYVELFNPTTSPIVLDGYYGDGPEIGYYQSGNSTWIYGGGWSQFGSYPMAAPSGWTIPADSYYLIANTGTFVLDGASVAADAYYYSSTSTALPDLIPAGTSGGPGWGIYFFYNQSDNWQTWDTVNNQISYTNESSGNGWSPGLASGHSIPLPDGLLRGDQIVRVSSPGYVSSQYARAYMSTDTWQNFTWNPNSTASTGQFITPYTTQSGTFTALSGVPAIGAIVTCNDGLSTYVKASVEQSTYSVLPSSQPYAYFALPAVATGTWNVDIDSFPWTVEIDTIAISSSGSTVLIPSTSTIPTLVPSNAPAGYKPMVMYSTTTMGYISGTVTDANDNPLNSIEVSITAGNTTTNSSGKYRIRLASGTYSVTANPNNLSPDYVSSTQNNVVVNPGQDTSDVNFMLSQGGSLVVWATKDGTNPLPSVEFVANNQDGTTAADVVTGSNGYATMVNLATGTYTIYPELDPLEGANPTNSEATLSTEGSTVFAGTFTVTGALGVVTGTVTYSGAAITTGVMVVVTTVTVTTPPTISSSTVTEYYEGSSQENGVYSISVRGSTTTTYNVYAFYTTYNGSTPSTSMKSKASVSVSAAGTTSGVNFSWP